MTAFDRTQSYAKIRRLLDGPKAQKPNPDKILSQMLIEEQADNLRITNSRQAANLISHTLQTVSGQREYTIPAPVASNGYAGKVYFVVRSTGNDYRDYLPVQYDDYNSLDYGQMPGDGIVNASLITPEKISFYRSGPQDQSIKAVISPTPMEILTYEIKFYTGNLDPAYAAMDKAGVMPEIVDLRDIRTALALLPYCEWPGKDEAAGDRHMQRLEKGLGFQLADKKPVVDDYIKQLNSPKSFDMGCWDDQD